MKDYINQSFKESMELMTNLLDDKKMIKNLEKAAVKCVDSLKNSGKILIAGNGGSAADAQHIAGELVSRFFFNRPGLPALALTTDSSILTAIGNDYGFENLFSRQIEAQGLPGDVFIAYSTSGKSPNILKALEVAKKLNIFTIGLTGNNQSAMIDLCDIALQVPSPSTPKIQEIHLILGHTLCGLIENEMFKEYHPKYLSTQQEVI